MTQNMVALGTIIEKARKIEGLLRELGAQGKGLKELGESLTPPLTSEDQSYLRHVYIVRNKATHEEHFTVSESELRKYHVAADLVIDSLGERLSHLAAPEPSSSADVGVPVTWRESRQVSVPANAEGTHQVDEPAPAPEPAKVPQSEPLVTQQQASSVSRPAVASTAKVEAEPSIKQKAKEVAVKGAVWAVVNWLKHR